MKSPGRVPAYYKKWPDEWEAQLNILLDDGVTCADCVHIPRCEALGYSWPARDQCDFYPNRFRSKEGKKGIKDYEVLS